MKRKLLLLVQMLFFVYFAYGQSLSHQAISSSGNSSSTLSWTVGQIAGETLTAGSNTLMQGFQQATYVISSNVENTKQTVNFYPNPTHGLIKIHSNDNSSQSIEVYDLSGKLLDKRTVKGETQLDLRGYNMSVFIIKIGTETFKVIKQ
ncbi:MAG: T9SS type A sorting domain-containing protein [Paludibacteraceae bacterium]|nr:T9SS type A sorting domain-containing protein [Paludibacteraceae bacterium]